MIVILKNGAAEEKKNQLIDWLKEQGLQIHTSVGEYQTVLGLVGDTSPGRYGPYRQSRHR